MNECNDPDHSAINAERSESRGLRKAWIELDDKRQELERELTAARAEISHMVSENGNMYLEIFIARHQRDRLAEALKNIASGNYSWRTCVDKLAPEALQSLNTNTPDQDRKSPASDGSI
jgi:undecaprenyl pyrophosphate synthase